ncbi:nucleotidyl transferase AbiEii/AbiGii toxin family protein [Pseudidiomarina sp. 1APP75-32.1]|uniref:Nucleotidyl transferase AbiEii/AbiGii toxin family protein n=1 Tax=Pseudidiomarina terrestris TaxID=2820060 RepID=A0AAW7QZW1_9GAMM|nr:MULTISPECIES: nucleotidyl transferase AbiEii/AbiGii toxin family protein [unclassified Pseudidiomarina]MDN7125294.1 nucleotidyl transferase AbiEii/AbiGii toxin family protein [Pseudidiomarina sp. 1APP75-32.1]MDN7130053.1 nucleotidyl transferase AbiEii/AbiGii toxin family protein [Pseudidiomarina sp. 1APR75-15]
MDRNSIYYRQVQLLMQVLPFVAAHDCFALKGGTAINLFVRDFPRLSVDIDLVFLPMMDRGEALQTITSHLEQIAKNLTAALQDVTVIRSFEVKKDALRLLVERDVAGRKVQIKIELSPVLRGTVYESNALSVTEAVENEFGFAEISVVSFADLYAGKICAALDRQHPRDLFDVKLLLDNEGLTDDIRKALIVYMISHPRTISELLRPNFKDITALYEGEFKSMADIDVPLVELMAAREEIVKRMHATFTDEERSFLLTFKSRKPDWSLLGIANIEQLPAVRWKLNNLEKMSEERHRIAYNKLKEALNS